MRRSVLEVPPGGADAPYPTTRAQLARWRYWERDVDFYPIATWPWGMQRMVMGEKLNYRDRLFLWLFLHGNGMGHERTVDSIRGAPGWRFDAAAVRHLEGLKRYSYSAFSRYSVWDMENQEYTTRIREVNGLSGVDLHKPNKPGDWR